LNRSLQALVLGTLIFALDQTSKQLALQWIPSDQPVDVIPGFFKLSLITNTGAAWGIMRDHGFWLTLLAIMVLLMLLAARRHFTHTGILPRIALGLLLGGIGGNLADRLMHGYVVDFLDFYIGSRHWPAFNVADSAICSGVALYLFDSFRRRPAPAGNEECGMNP